MNRVADIEQTVGSRQSNNFRDSFEHIIEWMRYRMFAETNVNRLLAIAQFYGTFRSFNFDGVYHDSEVEDIIEMRVAETGRLALLDMSKTSAGTVLVASNLADCGGHSRVVLNWLAAFKEENDHRLLITQTVSETYRSKLECQRICYRLCATQGVELINEVIAYCASAERVVLHIDPSDIVATIAARILAKSGKRIIFYNHADHRFSFGVSTANLVCEISSYGIEINRRAKRTHHACYLGIPIDFQAHKTYEVATVEKTANKIVLSAGESYKYAPGKTFFGDFVDDLLEQRSDVTVMLVGPSGNEPWWIEVNRRWCNRVCFLGKIPHSLYLDTMQKADVYIDSFPITGGTAFPEALLNGKLVAGLHSALEGYSPVDELRVEGVHALARHVISLLDGNPKSLHRIEEIRQKAVAAHSLTGFCERVRNIYCNCYDGGEQPRMNIDTYWLEKRWAYNTEVYLPGRILPASVPLRFGISFKYRVNRLLKPSTNKYRGYIVLEIIFRLFPTCTREYVKNMRERLFGYLHRRP